jgi:hypothetical protein
LRHVGELLEVRGLLRSDAKLREGFWSAMITPRIIRGVIFFAFPITPTLRLFHFLQELASAAIPPPMRRIAAPFICGAKAPGTGQSAEPHRRNL